MPRDDVEVHLDFAGGLKRVGTLHRHARRGREAVSFEYHREWLTDPARFSMEPALALTTGAFTAGPDRQVFGSIGDSAPDTWGRQLMQRAERRLAAREGRQVRTLFEVDYLLGVSDISRLGALRFRSTNDLTFQAPSTTGVPSLVELGRLLQATERILRGEEADDDLQLIFAPGSSLGGARPKASVVDQHGHLSIAKFPKETDGYRVELWEAVALRLATRAGILTPAHKLLQIRSASVLLSRRFDRNAGARVPFLSALAMMGLEDGDRGSYPELVDVLTAHGARAAEDARELFRRLVLNVLVSNVDDHLRNHGFLWTGHGGWALSPVFDLNPTPVDVRPRILATNISIDDGTCDLDVVESVAQYFGLAQTDAKGLIKQVAAATAKWRDVAKSLGARPAEILRMETAFEHADLQRALAL